MRAAEYGYYGTQHFYLEGHPEFVDAEGEWAHDRVTNEIVLKSGVVPAGIEHPQVPTLISVTATSNIDFKGLVFEGTAFDAPEQFGYVSDGSACYRTSRTDGSTEPCFSSRIPAALQIEKSSNVRILDSSFRHAFGSAIRIDSSSRVAVERTKLSDVAGAGIQALDVHDVTLQGNSFRSIGFAYASDAVAVISAVSGQQKIVIRDNAFEYLGARAIYMIQPVDLMFPAQPPSETSIVEGNRIDNVLNVIQDAGAINTGYITGLSILRNSITNVYNRGWNENAGFTNALYLDVGTYLSKAESNSISNAEIGEQLNCQAKNTLSNTFSNVATERKETTIFCLQATPASRKTQMENVLRCGDIVCR
jgi:hypothetical protein